MGSFLIAHIEVRYSPLYYGLLVLSCTINTSVETKVKINLPRLFNKMV